MLSLSSWNFKRWLIAHDLYIWSELTIENVENLINDEIDFFISEFDEIDEDYCRKIEFETETDNDSVLIFACLTSDERRKKLEDFYSK